MKIKFIIFDFYGVLYNPGRDKLNREIFEFIEDNNRKFGFGVITSGSRDVEFSLEEHNVDHYFMFVRTTSELGMSKISAELYKKVVSSISLNPDEVLMIDDSMHNLSAAAKAGLMTLHYDGEKSFETQIREIIG